MNIDSLSNTSGPAWFRSPFWEHARQRKWLYLIGGVLISMLLLAVAQRAFWRPAYVVPVQPLPRVNDPLLGPRPLNFPTTAIGNFPAYPSNDGGQVMPYVNRGKQDLVVKEAFFFEKNAGRPLIPGVAVPAYEFRFTPADYHADRRCFARTVSDFKFPAGAETRVVVRLVDPLRAGERRYGMLVLRCANGELIQFESAQVIVQPD